jgi:hypothetical protein
MQNWWSIGSTNLTNRYTIRIYKLPIFTMKRESCRRIRKLRISWQWRPFWIKKNYKIMGLTFRRESQCSKVTGRIYTRGGIVTIFPNGLPLRCRKRKWVFLKNERKNNRIHLYLYARVTLLFINRNNNRLLEVYFA